jgi:hypothetical protein
MPQIVFDRSRLQASILKAFYKGFQVVMDDGKKIGLSLAPQEGQKSLKAGCSGTQDVGGDGDATKIPWERPGGSPLHPTPISTALVRMAPGSPLSP